MNSEIVGVRTVNLQVLTSLSLGQYIKASVWAEVSL